ncbi:hypothetical protein I4U23_007441 [Adineta vaga]|nr:hypothetical protein I4U23_007441 [Adineta vaga]
MNMSMSATTFQPMMTTQSSTLPIYIITGFTVLTTTFPTSQITSQTTPVVSSRMTTSSLIGTSTSTSLPNNLLPLNPDTCNISNYVRLFNGTCVSKSDAQIISYDIIRNRSTDTNKTAYALSLYISSITNLTNVRNSTYVLTVDEIDNALSNLSVINLAINSNTSFVMAQQLNQSNNVLVLGASFKRAIGGDIVDTSNRENIIKSNVTAAAIVNREYITGISSINMIIIDKPTGYENIDNKTNKTLASSVIIVNLRRNSSTFIPLSVSLYFNPLAEYKQNGSGKYLCSFFNTNTSTWSEMGCTNANFSKEFNRYECSCNHTTSFALLWLPQSLLTTTYTKQLDAQDITSLIFQLISIICFIIILIHAITIRIINPMIGIEALHLLPLISTASSTLLFIFYIALALTAYTQTSSSDQRICFSSSIVLMFITYFLLIFMFCVKTITGYFYFIRFIRLFPQPSHGKLFIMLIIGFIIASLCIALAIGFNSRSTQQITQLYPYKLCWFTYPVIHYFMTIPIGIFLFTNFITIIFVANSIFNHARNATTSKQINERLKRCVIVLLSSCVSQGFGWIFGPLISFVNPTAGQVVTWIFIIINGLEGVWSVLLYVFIRSQRLYEQKHTEAAIELAKASTSSSNKIKRLNKQNSDQFPLSSLSNVRKRESINNSSGDDVDDM